MDIIHVTAAYSNAVLVAVLPYFSDFAARLDLPIQRPITTNQVRWSHSTPWKGYISAGVILTNDYFFAFHWQGYDGKHGIVDDFHAPTNWFSEEDFTNMMTKYFGKDHMTTNEAIAMARETLRKLGYKPEFTHSYETPTLDGPFDTKFGHVPYCSVTWEWPKTDELRDQNQITVEINMELKTLAGMTVSFSPTNDFHDFPAAPEIPTNVVQELESDYQKRMKESGKMFIDTNAPLRFPGAPSGRR
jgi:hypothetical protein